MLTKHHLGVGDPLHQPAMTIGLQESPRCHRRRPTKMVKAHVYQQRLSNYKYFRALSLPSVVRTGGFHYRCHYLRNILRNALNVLPNVLEEALGAA